MNKNKLRMKRLRETRALWLFVIPGIVFYLTFKYYPIYGSQIAFRNYSPWLGFTKSPWVGLKNFERFFRSPDCWRIIRNTLEINLVNLLIGFPVPIILAVMISQVSNKRFKKTVQTITYAPYFISMVVLVGIMYSMFSPFGGVVSAIARMLGANPPFIMGDPKLYVWVYVLSSIWQTSGWLAIVYIAALSSVSPELHESAIVDGATRMQRILHIDIPCIRSTIITMLTLAAGQMLTIGFEKSYLMQNSINMEVSEVLAPYTYKKGLINGDFSYATAVELMQCAVNFIILITVNRISKRVTESSLW